MVIFQGFSNPDFYSIFFAFIYIIRRIILLYGHTILTHLKEILLYTTDSVFLSNDDVYLDLMFIVTLLSSLVELCKHWSTDYVSTEQSSNVWANGIRNYFRVYLKLVITAEFVEMSY